MRRDDMQNFREEAKRLKHELELDLKLAETRGRDFTAREAAEWDEKRTKLDNLTKQIGLADNPVRFDDRAFATSRTGGFGYKYSTDVEPLLAEFRKAGFARGEPAEIPFKRYQEAGEYRSFTWSGGMDNLQPRRSDGVALGYDQRWIYPAFQQVDIGSDVTALQILRETSRSLATAANVVRAVDAVTAKPETSSTLDLTTVSVKQVATISTLIPNVILEQDQAGTLIQNDLRLALNDGLDKLVIDGTLASGFQAPGTDPLLVSIRKAMTTIQASGYSPDLVAIRPADAEALDTLRATTTATEQYYVFAPAQLAPRELFGLQVRISKTVAAPIVFDSTAFGKMYAAPVRLATFEDSAGTTNRSNVRMELNAAFGVERQAAAIRIAAS
jgi:hypothetical protein